MACGAPKAERRYQILGRDQCHLPLRGFAVAQVRRDGGHDACPAARVQVDVCMYWSNLADGL